MSDFQQLANCIRALSIDAVEKANSGHPGMPMGMADAATVLFSKYLKYDAKNPKWVDRDRFVLSNGHGSMLLYSLLYLTGYEDMTIEEIKNFRQLKSKTAGHPEYGEAAGIEVTTGPLGQGLAAAVGMGIAEKTLKKEFGEDLINHRIWVFAGDGCLMEGVGQEAISLAGHLGLDNLIVVFDNNSISIDGSTELSRTEDIYAKITACNWHVISADGHDEDSINQAYAKAITIKDKPVLINLKTIIGFGAPNKSATAGAHGSPLGSDEANLAKQELNWSHDAFVIPDDLFSIWRSFGTRNNELLKEWQSRFAKLPQDQQKNFERRMIGELPLGFNERMQKHKLEMINNPSKIATRKASQNALEIFSSELPELIGGSADLTGSNLTKVSNMEVFGKDNPGRYVHFGVREFAMAAAMNGIALHGGLIPYGGTFLVFSDYARNAIRLAALMNLRVVFVMTHDSIGLGEDGPTHQPVEHLASLRAIPNLKVFRPCDQVETFECWELALANNQGPSILSLTRQGVEQLRLEDYPINQSAKGAYLIKDTEDKRKLTILATGSEVAIAVEAAKKLDALNHPTAVVSMPCWELFAQQDQEYQDNVLGNEKRIAVEAAGKFGWTRYVASEDDVIGLDGFGVSAPAPTAYSHFNITSEYIVSKYQNQ